MSIEKTLKERGAKYGHYKDGAAIMQQLKDVYRSCPGWDRLTPDMKEAFDMTAHKQGRILNGVPTEVDHWHDIIGYNRLVELLLTGENP